MTVKNAVFVMSGKGGVGKSSMTVQLALYLRNLGKKVGILDADLCGPSIPRLLNIDAGIVEQGPTGWIPIAVMPFDDGHPAIKVMSLGFLMSDPDSAVIWRGPKKTAMISRFLTAVAWGDLDVLLVDTPPGTSDEHLAIALGIQNLEGVVNFGAMIVTTPQLISLQDVQRQISFCREVKVPIFGVIENMSGYICKKCQGCNNLFSTGGGEQLAEKANIAFLGRLPIDSAINSSKSSLSIVDGFGLIGSKLNDMLVY